MQFDPYLPSLGVLADVGQCLLHYAEESDLYRARQALVSEFFFIVDLVIVFTQAFDLQGDSGFEPKIIKCRRPQIPDNLP
jgi:hypothetical protein